MPKHLEDQLLDVVVICAAAEQSPYDAGFYPGTHIYRGDLEGQKFGSFMQSLFSFCRNTPGAGMVPEGQRSMYVTVHTTHLNENNEPVLNTFQKPMKEECRGELIKLIESWCCEFGRMVN